MRINHNITAVRTNTQLNRNNNYLSVSTEKLSSGRKINKAQDDPTGIAIAKRMHTQLLGLERGNSNSGDGISAIQTAEGAMGEIESILQRMRELANQAANGTYGPDDRATIQDEIVQLKDEITRISKTTEYNGKILLDGSQERESYVTKSTDRLSEKTSVLSISAGVAVGEYKVNVIKDPEKATGSVSIVAGSERTISINGENVEILATDSSGQIAEKIREVADRCDIDVEVSGSSYRFTSRYYGSEQKIEVKMNSATVLTAVGRDVKASIVGGDFPSDAVVSVSGNLVKITGADGFEMKVKTSEGSHAEGTAEVNVVDAGSMKLQIGGSESQMLEVIIPRLDAETLQIENVNVRTQNGAEKALDAISEAISMTSKARSQLGAYQNRLERTQSNLDVAQENLNAAIARIEDTDMATEMTQYTQLSVLTQAGTSILAKANTRPESVLQLLQGM